MLLSTHGRIAQRIASELKLSQQEAHNLEEGSRIPDYWKNFPHHYGKEHETKKRIIEARRNWLNDEKLESLFNLGIALHYIQDGWVTVPSSSMNHGWWEDQIDDAPFVDDLVKILKEFDLTRLYREPPALRAQEDEKQYLQMNEQLLEFGKLCRNNFKGHDGRFAQNATLYIATLKHPTLGAPIFDLNFECKVSLIVALSVCGAKTSSTLQHNLKQTKKEFEVRLKEAEETQARKLVELKNKRAELRQKGGVINGIKGLICNFNLWINRRLYRNRSHLLHVQQIYYREVERKISPFRSWYDIAIPRLDIEEVERLLV